MIHRCSRIFALTAGTLACLAVASSARARDLFVDNMAGNDRADGQAQALVQPGIGPVRTLGRALQLADAADRIFLANTGTPYHESVCLQGDRNSGYYFQPFTINGGGATLDGSVPVPADVWQNYRDDVFRFRPRLMAHQELFLDGLPAKRRAVSGTLAGLPPLAPREWALADGTIYFRVDQGRLPLQYHATFSDLSVGMTLYKVRYVLITNLIVEGYQLDGINAQDASESVTIADVTAQGNGRSGIAVGGASHVLIDSCRLGSNGESQLHIEGPGETRVERSDIVAKSGPEWLVHDSRLTVDGQPVK